jgi:hypothetical protein
MIPFPKGLALSAVVLSGAMGATALAQATPDQSIPPGDPVRRKRPRAPRLDEP